MKISSNIAEYQVNEFIKVLKKSKIKKASEEWIEHLVMFVESRSVFRIENCSMDWDEFLENYCEYWGLVL